MGRQFTLALLMVVGFAVAPVSALQAEPQTPTPATPSAPTQTQAAPQPQPSPNEAQPAPQAQPSPTAEPRPITAQDEKPRQRSRAKENDRIFGVIPNYRTVEDEELQPSKLSAGEKFKLGLQDSFDYYAYPAAGIFAGIAMAQRNTPSFGQGA